MNARSAIAIFIEEVDRQASIATDAADHAYYRGWRDGLLALQKELPVETDEVKVLRTTLGELIAEIAQALNSPIKTATAKRLLEQLKPPAEDRQ